MNAPLDWLFDSNGYMPHGHCYLWQPPVLWLHVGSNALIALAYFTIPAILYYFVRRRRHEIPFVGIPLLFAAFILLCGATHVFGIWTVWNPDYRADGLLKLVTGLVSAGTAVALLKVMPQAIALQTPAQLQREVDVRTHDLEAANAQLRREIDARLATETRLRESEERFRLATRALRGYIYEYNAVAGRMTRSEGFDALLGIPRDEAPEDLAWWRARVHPDDAEAMAALGAALRDGAGDASAEYRVRAGDGRYVWIWDHCVAVRDAAGVLTRVVGNVLDVTPRRQAEEERRQLLESERTARAEAERANRIKQEFLATLSHELRTPLSTVITWARLLKLKPADPENVRRAAEVIDQNARAQTQMISDLLDMSRIDSGKMRLDVQPVDLGEIIDAAVTAVQPAAEARGIRIARILEPVSGTVRGDPSRLQQVMWNLLSNAIKFTPKQGRVQVALARVNSHVEITVSDTGKGINPAFLPHLFERFRQADTSHAREHGGLGLGLSIVRQLVEMHGGRIHASSAGLDRGATFTVELPLAPLQAASDTRTHPGAFDAAPVPEGLTLGGLTVLVVDDQPDALEGIARLLEAAGAQVLATRNAAEALDWALSRSPDVLVSDIGMPGLDGYELIRALRTAGSAVPAAALTALARPEDRSRALLAGYTVHMTKPVDGTELLATVAALARARPDRTA